MNPQRDLVLKANIVPYNTLWFTHARELLLKIRIFVGWNFLGIKDIM